MAVLSKPASMGVVAAAAIAVATWCAAAAGGGAGIGALDVPLVVLAPALLAGVVITARRKATAVLPPGTDVVVLTAVTVAGFVGLYLIAWTTREHEADVARLLPLAVVALGALWPEPKVLRYTLLLAAVTLFGSIRGPVTSRPAVGAALAAMALALVATNRLTAASGPRLGGTAPARGRRVAGEAAAVLVIVGLLAALASSLLPPPPGGGGGGGSRNGPLPQPAAPALQPPDRLDVAGGRGAPGNDVVLLIGTTTPDVWRATTYDHWDGEAWTRAPETLTLVPGSVGAPGIGDVAVAGPPGLARFQSVTVLARTAGVLVAAARPAYVAAGVAVRQGRDATLYPATPLVRGGGYIVSSTGDQAPGRALRAVGETPAAAVPTDVADAYLQLPAVDPSVRALAADITARRTTTYDQVRAVESWIHGHTKVTADAQPVPPADDALETFLLGNRSGPAERAATSMIVMLRALGVPSRLAVGFLPGTRTGPDRDFLVRSRDAHAWVEVWFPGHGWQRFDPTGKAPDAHASESVWDRLFRFLRRLWPLGALLVLGAVGWLSWAAARWWKRRAALPWSTRFFARVERAGSARGRPRRPHETPAEYVDGLAAGALPDPRLAQVGELVTVAAWSRHEPPAPDRARAEQILREATKAAPAHRLRRARSGRPRRSPAQGPTIAKP